MRTLLAAVLVAVSAPALAQTPRAPVPPMSQDAQVDPFLRQYAETRRFLAGRPVGATITPDEQTVFFLRAAATSPVQTLWALDVKSGEARELLTPDALLKGAQEQLTAEERAMLERKRISARGFTSYALSEDGQRLLVTLSGKLYVVERQGGKVTPLKTGEGPVLTPRFSRDGRHVAYVRDNDVYRIDLAQNVERRVTRGGTEQKPHGLAEFVAQEEMSRFMGFWWSPDARTLAYQETDHAGMEVFSIQDPMHPEQAPNTFPYPRAGRPNAKVRLGLTPAAGGKTTWVRWDMDAYPYLATVEWPEQGPLTLVVQNREQTEEQVLAVDVKTGATRVLFTEKDPLWINLEQAFPHWLADGSGFLWQTERNGGPEVELRNADGSLARSLVKLDEGFLQFVRYVDPDGTLYFNGGPNPTESYLWRVPRGGKPERVPTGVKGPANDVGQVSRKGNLALIQHSGPDSMPVSWVQRLDGTRVGELPEVAQEPSLQPTTEVRRVGSRQYWVSVTRPRDFKPGQKLPVLLSVYAGPTTTVVKQSKAAHLLTQWMADQGFLVVKVDGRGTPGRGAAWERAYGRDFSRVLEDQIDALEALAQEVPELDLARVGVEGWSFGGYASALAVLRHGDFFKAAVAGAPVVDWNDYDTHYTERYLGVPPAAREAYDKSSLLTYASRLERPLLVIHGTADDNVYFFHTLKLSDALFRAGKPHELLPLSGLTHMVPDPLVMTREYEREMGFFRKHLAAPAPAAPPVR